MCYFPMTRRLRHGLLLASVLVLLGGALTAAQALAGQQGPAPAPRDISGTEARDAIQQVNKSLFFLESFNFSGKVEVEADRFLIPNGHYAKMAFTWTKLVSTTGANVLRQPTAEEVKNERFFRDRFQLYASDKEAKPAYATGSVKLSVPTKFAHLTFKATEVNIPRQDGPLDATLLSCKGNAVKLQARGKLQREDIVVVLRDAAGKRLAEAGSSSMQMKGSDTATINYQAAGTIASVDLFTATEYVTETLDVLATTEPDTFGQKTIDVKVPRYAPSGNALKEAEFTLDTLKAQTSIAAGRSDAMMGYNTPLVAITLPHVLNSAYAKIDFGKPQLTDAKGKAIAYSAEEGIFDVDTGTDEFRFRGAQDYAFVTGTVHLRYPAKLNIVTLTLTKPSAGAVQARFDGAKVKVNVEDPGFGAFLPEDLASVRAYDASGRLLKRLSYSGNEFSNQVNWWLYAFWGTPTQLRVVTIEKWLTVDLPYRLPATPKLPPPSLW